MNWTEIAIASLWPIAFVVVLIAFMHIFKKQIRSLNFKNPSFGEILVELNQKEKIVEKEHEELLPKLDTTGVWALNDIIKAGGIQVININPVQKYIYNNQIADGLVENQNGKLKLTILGQQVYALAQMIKL